MMKVRMLGEHPDDINAIINLLNGKFSGLFSFFPLLYGIHGSNLENPKIKHLLRKEYQIKNPDIILFIRDLDALETDRIQLQKRNAYFIEFNKVVDNKGLYLLNIYELEALLLADIETVNRFYKTNLDAVDDCMRVPDPKGYLKKTIKNYRTGDNPELFALLNYQTVVDNCRYFQKFTLKLERVAQ